jgi:NAD+ diphosphatase
VTRAILFSGDQLWIRRAGGDVEYAFEASPAGPAEPVDATCAVASADEPPAEGAERIGVRAAFDLVPAGAFARIGLARQLLHWRLTHRFCGACGAPLVRHATERAMHCAACGTCTYPRLNPVVITLVTRGSEILLAHKAGGAIPFWSLVAGFVEANESLEAAVEREVAEEVGVRVANIRYAGSQPWPFPNNLMLGFTADYAGGEVTPDGVEIGEAGWFGRDNLPPLPSRFSIARRLIDAFFADG